MKIHYFFIFLKYNGIIIMLKSLSFRDTYQNICGGNSMSGIASEYFKKERINGVVDEAGLTVVSWLLGIYQDAFSSFLL